MGTNRRYEASIDRRMGEKIVEATASKGPLQTLTDAELQRSDLPVTIDPKPRPVLAWVRFGSSPVQVRARALRWTPRAVGIEFEIAGTTHRAWVWASAVEQLDA